MRKKTSANPKTRTRRKKPKASVLRSPGVLRKRPWSEATASSEEPGMESDTAAEPHANDSFEGHGAEGTITTLHTTTLLQRKSVTHAFSTKVGGVSSLAQRALSLGSTSHDFLENIEENRRRFFEAVGLAAIPTVPLRQVHGDTVHFIERLPAATLVGDGVFTDRDGLVLGVATSDCVPILLAHRDGRFVSAVHAGWRGTAARIAEKAVREACAHYGTKAGDIFAGLGPCIHKCCYPVRPDVREAFQNAGLPLGVFEEDGNPDVPSPASDAKTFSWRLDLVEANVLQLLAAGLPPRNIEVVDRCTSCDASLFFSHRRDGEYAGRMMSVIVKGEG
jgi:hypothetical protein